MCRLFGLIADRQVDLTFSLEKFKEFSKENYNGWGIGWYNKNKTMLFKQSISAKDPKSKFSVMEKNVKSKIIIAHVRKGPKSSKENSHPFRHEKYLFAHNGQVDRKYILSLLSRKYKSYIVGETDSEVYFYWLLQNIEKSGNVIGGIPKTIKEVKRKKHEGLNFLLSDGKNLYAFRSGNPKSDFTLYYLKKRPSRKSGIFEFLSEKTMALLKSKSLKRESSILVCSEPITNEKWKEIKSGHLITVNNSLNIREIKI